MDAETIARFWRKVASALCLDHTDPVKRFWERMGERYLSMPMQLGIQGFLIAPDATQARALH